MDHPTRDFHTFFQGWVTRLELYLHQLLDIIQSIDEHEESELQQLVRLVMTHYHDYFVAKARLIRQDVFLVMSPPWFNSYEQAHFWLGGFKPSLAINVLKNCGAELSSDQEERVERLRTETKEDEKEISERFAMVEQQVLTPRLILLACMGGREVSGMVREADNAMDRMAEDLTFLVGCADYLRQMTAVKLVEILSTNQRVRFLAAIVLLQMTVRSRGQAEMGVNGDHS